MAIELTWEHSRVYIFKLGKIGDMWGIGKTGSGSVKSIKFNRFGGGGLSGPPKPWDN